MGLYYPVLMRCTFSLVVDAWNGIGGAADVFRGRRWVLRDVGFLDTSPCADLCRSSADRGGVHQMRVGQRCVAVESIAATAAVPGTLSSMPVTPAGACDGA